MRAWHPLSSPTGLAWDGGFHGLGKVRWSHVATAYLGAAVQRAPAQCPPGCPGLSRPKAQRQGQDPRQSCCMSFLCRPRNSPALQLLLWEAAGSSQNSSFLLQGDLVSGFL